MRRFRYHAGTWCPNALFNDPCREAPERFRIGGDHSSLLCHISEVATTKPWGNQGDKKSGTSEANREFWRPLKS